MLSAKIAVAIPARNEAQRLPRLLAALARQRGTPHFALCLHFDNCDDGSAACAASWATNAPYAIHTSEDRSGGWPNAGAARRRAMELAQRIAPDGVLMTTDADSEPDDDWIASNLAALDHADIVAGRIVRRAGVPSPAQDRVERYLDRLHALRRRLDPVEWEAPQTHHWTSATSLAMASATYTGIGGMPPHRTGEDAALVDVAARLGFRTRRDAAVVVRTSARRTGRVTGGFASALTASDDRDHAPMVAHPADEAWRYAHHAMARVLHGTDDYATLAKRLALPLREIHQVADECPNGEAFAARIVGAPPGGMRHIALGQAEQLVECFDDVMLEGAA